MKQYTLDVEITERRSLQVVLTSDKKPTMTSVMEALNNQDYDDVIDEESIETVSVDKLKITDTQDLDEEE